MSLSLKDIGNSLVPEEVRKTVSVVSYAENQNALEEQDVEITLVRIGESEPVQSDCIRQIIVETEENVNQTKFTFESTTCDENDASNIQFQPSTFVTESEGVTKHLYGETLEFLSNEGNSQEDGEYLLQISSNFRTTILQNLSEELTHPFLDLPVFCTDGVAYTSKVLIAAASVLAREVLTCDSESVCLILPGLTKLQFQSFHQALLSENLVGSNISDITVVASCLGIELGHGIFERNEGDLNTVDYTEAFKMKERNRLATCLDVDLETGSSRCKPHDKSQNLEALISVLDNSDWECQICQRKFVDEGSLSKHLQMLHSNKLLSSIIRPLQFDCSFCPQKFRFAANLKKHLWFNHKSQNPLRLSVNEDLKRPNQTDDPRTHLKQDQLLERYEDMTCKFCSKVCKGWKQLQIHVMDHTTERPFKCKTCGKGFKEEAKLKRHNITHTGEKPHQCHFCLKRFNLAHNLKVHEMRHQGKGHECPFCGKVCSSRTMFTSHTLVHKRRRHAPSTDVDVRERQRIKSSQRGRPRLTTKTETEMQRVASPN